MLWKLKLSYSKYFDKSSSLYIAFCIEFPNYYYCGTCISSEMANRESTTFAMFLQYYKCIILDFGQKDCIVRQLIVDCINTCTVVQITKSKHLELN